MKLYHGTNCSIEAIDLAKCRPYKDFGKGFYLTELEQQAKDWAALSTLAKVNEYGL